MIYNFFKQIPLFSDLPDKDLISLCSMVDELKLSAGDELFSEGSPGDRAYIIRSGELEVLKTSERREVLLAVRKTGEVIGEMALLEDTPRTATVRARTDSELLAIRKELLDELLKTSVSAGRALFYTMLNRWREMHAALRQSEKMAELGKLTAGVAHELNNPASAVARGTSQLQSAIQQLTRAQAALDDLALTKQQHDLALRLASRIRQTEASPEIAMDALARSDREAEMEEWLEDHGIQDAWVLAPTMVSLGLGDRDLEEITDSFEPSRLPKVIEWVHAKCEVDTLLAEVQEGSRRISEIVGALKSYSYLDQAPVQDVDIHTGLENTLLILRHKLKSGITIHREFDPALPHIQANGSELNQVWTNLIDNAADSLKGSGDITLRTRNEGDWVVVEVEDNGPGIPPEIQTKIFDPFFTTKPVGKGTGLGLDISYNIVVHKHGGELLVDSEPGRTNFQVRLPMKGVAR